MDEQLKTSSHPWRKLDNAAKVFPATANKKNTKVFRFYCELYEEVIEKNLQQALEMTLEKFPLFKSVLRRGLFWFYLEANEYIPQVKQEEKPPCSSLYTHDRQKYLFRVNYYKKRINLEVFHVLTDGTGATEFLKELVKNYLYITHEECQSNTNIVVDEQTFLDQEKDGFTEYYSDVDKKEAKQKKKKQQKGAHQIHGIKSEYETLQVVEGVVDSATLLQKAKQFKVSITVLLSAILIFAIYQEMNLRQTKKPIVLMIPVNLRKFFPSKSMMNFFGYINPGYRFGLKKEPDTLQDVIDAIQVYFKQELTKKNMAMRMNGYTKLERNPFLRVAPLEMKNIGIQAGFANTGRDLTAIFSNMSIVHMPEVCVPYIKQFGVFTSTHKVELCMCSFQERMVLNFTSYFDSVNIQRNFFRILKDLGVEAELTVEPFPEIDEEKKRSMHFQQCLNFTAITLVTLVWMLHVLIWNNIMYSMIAMAIILALWCTFTVGYQKRKNYLKNGIYQISLLMIGAILADVLLGYQGWSIDYVFPGLSLVLLLYNILLISIQRMKSEEYMIYMILSVGIGMIPLPLLLFHCIQEPFLTVLCIGCNILVISFLAIFKKRALLMEIQKNFHI